ncbi:TerD family protein [Nocardia neocaledoniensis]|uniref:TerD family protein n=1 Tax=Nocardia neocaledoniensis TaxID=236511 RepID=UPI0024546766|nr:TerD family protein [Nocardia neocaledoniensis]
MTGSVPQHRPPLEHVTMGLGWDPANPDGLLAGAPKDIDLNAAALLFAGPDFYDVAYHEQLTSRDGAVRHLGDSVTGDGDGDNEAIVVDLTRIDPAITTIVFLVSCYTGQRFGQIQNGFCRVIDNVTGIEMVRFDLADAASHTGLVIGRLHAHHGSWEFTPILAPIHAEHIADAVPLVAGHLG